MSKDNKMKNEGMEQEVPQEISPETQKDITAYTTGLSRMLHGPDTQPNVMSMLESGEPEQVIPQVALTVNAQMEEAVRQKGKPPTLEVLLNASAFLVGDLIEMGNAAGIFQIESEEQVQPILQGTLQMYIEKGLADGTIDPVELQTAIEPLMSDEHKELGLRGGEMSGIPATANEQTALNAHGAKERRAGMQAGALQMQRQQQPQGGK